MILLILVSNGLFFLILGLWTDKLTITLTGLTLLALATVLKKLTKGFGNTEP